MTPPSESPPGRGGPTPPWLWWTPVAVLALVSSVVEITSPFSADARVPVYLTTLGVCVLSVPALIARAKARKWVIGVAVALAVVLAAVVLVTGWFRAPIAIVSGWLASISAPTASSTPSSSPVVVTVNPSNTVAADNCVQGDIEFHPGLTLAPKTGFDFDCARTVPLTANVTEFEISGRAGGRELDAINGDRRLAAVPDLAATDFDKCARLKDDAYGKSVPGLEKPLTGMGICVRTTDGGLAIVKPTAPYRANTDLTFDYAIRRPQR